MGSQPVVEDGEELIDIAEELYAIRMIWRNLRNLSDFKELSYHS